MDQQTTVELFEENRMIETQETQQTEAEKGQSLEVIIRTLITVPKDWQIDGDELEMPDGRIIKFWPEFELFTPEPESYVRLEWSEAEDLGVFFNAYREGNRISILPGKTS